MFWMLRCGSKFRLIRRLFAADAACLAAVEPNSVSRLHTLRCQPMPPTTTATTIMSQHPSTPALLILFPESVLSLCYCNAEKQLHTTSPPAKLTQANPILTLPFHQISTKALAGLRLSGNNDGEACGERHPPSRATQPTTSCKRCCAVAPTLLGLT